MAGATLCVPTSNESTDGWESIYTNMKNKSERYTALVIIGELSGFVSILGSAFIIYLILREKKWRVSTFERFIFGLSAADLINSTALVLQPFLVPKCTELPFGHGTTTTCRVVGFLGTFLLLSFLYSCSIVIYFLTTLRINRRAGSTKVCGSFVGEMVLHCCLWTYAILYAIFAVVFDLIKPSPFVLTCVPRTPDRDDEQLQWIFQMMASVVFLFSCPIGFVCTLILYKRLRSMSTPLLLSDSDSISAEAGILAEGYQISSISLPPITSTNNPASSNTMPMSSATTESQATDVQGATPATTTEDEVNESEDEAKDVHFVHDEGGDYVDDGESSQVVMVTTDRRNRFLTQQALWYSFGFLITIGPIILSTTVEGTLLTKSEQILDESPPMIILISLFLTYTIVPLQGFVNCLIYLRPRLLLWKDSCGEHHSWLWVCQQIVACREMPPPTLRTAHLVRYDT